MSIARRAPDLARIAAGSLAEPARTAAERGAASFYTDLGLPPGTLRVCHGTSCVLHGSQHLHQRLEGEARCGHAYCLGHCDRSPAVLRPDGSVADACDARSTPDVLRGPDAGPVAVRALCERPIVLERTVQGDHAALADARRAGVYATLAAALRRPPAEVLDTVQRGKLRGRGGAGFPVGAKWQACAATPAARRFVVANGDEGDPGSFVDRVLMEQDPHALLEGMALCGYAVGAHEGVVFIRSEYPRAVAVVERAIAEARAAGLMGRGVFGTAFDFDVVVFVGMGSYVCGEETALLNAIEGRRGEVRLRPPYPAEAGLFGLPTVVNNVETLLTVPWLVRQGAAEFTARGTAASPGTKALCLNRGFARPGLVEVEFGTPLRAVLEDAGGTDGLAALLLGGPMGCVVGPEHWDAPVCYGALAERGLQLGHGGLVALPAGADLPALIHHWLTFMADESCGKCVPCRSGSRTARDLAGRLNGDTAPLRHWLEVIAAGSLCAFGQLIPPAVIQLLDRLEAEGGRR